MNPATSGENGFRSDITIQTGSVHIGVSNTASDALIDRLFEVISMLAEAISISKIIIAYGRTNLRKGIDSLAQLIGTSTSNIE